MTPAPKHFATPTAFRRWLERHHASERELWILFHKKASGKAGMTYREALDEALCFGWIDGRVKSIDGDSYMQRFTPRRPGSIWSNVNVRHIARLTAAGKMHPAGLTAFAARDEKKTGVYSFEKRPENFPADLEKIFRAKPTAWRFWQAQPPGYRRVITHWVISAKREETRQRRLTTLITESAAGRRIDFLKPPGRS
jgi:uncharacterized protein YdeI (YjbR/CyaY-like superfamily)